MTTHVAFILDETGSMYSRKKDTIGSFNQYIEDLKKEKDIRFSLTLFNSAKTELRYKGVRPSKVKPLDAKTYVPSNSTPLYDAIGKTTSDIGKRKKKVLVVILTDGLENASREYNKEAIKNIIKEREEKGWRFLFLGCDFDAMAEGMSLGLQRGQTLNFKPDDIKGATRTAYVATSSYVSRGSSAKFDLEEEYEKNN